MNCGAVPCVAFNHALSWEKCRYDLTAWNRQRAELTGSDALQLQSAHAILISTGINMWTDDIHNFSASVHYRNQSHDLQSTFSFILSLSVLLLNSVLCPRNCVSPNTSHTYFAKLIFRQCLIKKLNIPWLNVAISQLIQNIWRKLMTKDKQNTETDSKQSLTVRAKVWYNII